MKKPTIEWLENGGLEKINKAAKVSGEVYNNFKQTIPEAESLARINLNARTQNEIEQENIKGLGKSQPK